MESNPTLEGMRQIVTLSFNHLPHELKGCMMYFSIFPEDYVIETDRLFSRWIAEGLVSERRGLTLREVAESYLDELLCRNMIEQDHTDPRRVNLYCRVHDLLLEVMVSLSLEANFVSLQGGPYNGLSYARIRRLSIHGIVNSGDSATMRRAEEVINVKHVRSVTIFHPQEHMILDQLGKFTLLRVLDLQGCEGVTNKHVKYACQMHLLKFLSLRDTNVSMLPPQIGDLEHLQLLDLYGTLLDDLPKDVTKLARLEVLEIRNKKDYLTKWKLPQGISKMKALRRLRASLLGNDTQVAQEVGELEQLEDIEIHIGPETKCAKVLEEIAMSLSRRYALRQLTIFDLQREYKALNFLHLLPTPPRLLRNLVTHGQMDDLPSWIGSLTYLVDCAMFGASVDSDQLFRTLCGLPNLKNLNVSWKCHNGNEIVARTSYKFPMLSYLWIAVHVPKVIRFELGSMERLEYFVLKLFRSDQTVVTIDGIEHLTTLKQVTVISGKDYPALLSVLEQLMFANNRRSESSQFKLGLDDPQPSNLALQAEKQEPIKRKKNKKKVVVDEDDDDEDDLSGDLALLMRKMKTFNNKFISKSKGKCFNYGLKNHFVQDCPKPKKEAFKAQESSDKEEEDPKAKHQKKRYFNKDKGKGKEEKKKFSRKALVGKRISDNSSEASSSSSEDEEVAVLAMIRTTLARALPPPPTCLMATIQLRESEDKNRDDNDDEELSCTKLWSMLEVVRGGKKRE
ncbi:hypothetical protein PR202_gb12439 [Eleusine coracana subsp. coracana]|uniref:Uncharacterized protein n=1 Tax=Eleusine coracana subsp. coracana TaxID=191504 RepID=A0AAV5EN10_ELECO|nr:hypothetical protein PR202_gb12439 [Eleusine coracana subsp. coracana]